MTAIIRCLPAGEPVLGEILTQILKELWGAIEDLFDRCQAAPKVVEKLCRFVKHMMRALDQNFSDYLLQFFNIISRHYANNPLSPYVYSVEFSVTVFSKYPDAHPYLSEIFEFMVTKTFGILNTREALEQHPDLSEDFYGMMVRYLTWAPSIIICSASFLNLCEMALGGIGISHTEAAKALYYFLETLMQIPGKKQVSEDLRNAVRTLIVTKMGSPVIIALANAMLLYPPPKVREYIRDIFKATLRTFKEDCIKWFQEAFHQVLNLPSIPWFLNPFRCQRTF
jgi:hypothetical protein